ncbi:MAG: nucleotidyltransferase domain-containing protein, partial [Halobacteria archaeon]|nr:nucleotidyltransferase domain-containing protein [Halobacteria archaeon]
RQEGRKKLISANRDRFHNPEDPLLSIPQEEFRTPIKEFLEKVKKNEGGNLVGVILFGSVARGEADRASDIDLQVIVENDLTESRQELHDIRQEMEDRRFDGERYEFQVLVESVESAESYGEKLQEIFSEGITLYATDRLDQVREVIFSEG